MKKIADFRTLSKVRKTFKHPLTFGLLKQSPWGEVQGQETLLPGVVVVWTAGHGGFKVSRARYHAMPDCLKINHYGGGVWFEEDCEWALVAFAFLDEWLESPNTHATKDIIISTMKRYFLEAYNEIAGE